MKHTRTIRRIAIMVMCLTFVASIVAAALPQPAQAAPGSDSKLSFNTWISNGKVYIDISKYNNKAKFQVKLRDAETANKWYKMGTIKLAKNTAQSSVYKLPKQLAKTFYIQVCLKNLTSDKLNCKTVVNPGT